MGRVEGEGGGEEGDRWKICLLVDFLGGMKHLLYYYSSLTQCLCVTTLWWPIQSPEYRQY